MPTPAVLLDPRPLASVARPASDRIHVRRAVVCAGGGWLATAGARVRAELEAEVGLTRGSPVMVTAYPPHMAAAVLDDITDADEFSVKAARIALSASTTPWLWLFVATCLLTWPQRTALAALS